MSSEVDEWKGSNYYALWRAVVLAFDVNESYVHNRQEKQYVKKYRVIVQPCKIIYSEAIIYTKHYEGIYNFMSLDIDQNKPRPCFLRSATCIKMYTQIPNPSIPEITPKPMRYFGLSSAGKRYAP
jgi:hypothetical protein